MTTAADLQADLARVNTAIARIEESLTQSHSVKGDQHVSPNLATLYAERTRLRREIDATTAGVGQMRRVRVVN